MMRKVGKSIFYEKEEVVEKVVDNNETEKCRNEIIVSEAEYLGHLRVLNEAYIKPLSPILSSEESCQLFGNIETVTMCSERLLGELCNTNTTTDMYEVLVTAANSYLQAYIQYCSNLPLALTLLLRLIEERNYFREKVGESEGDERGIALQAYLLKPFQRLTRLPLLLAPLEKAGDPATPAIRAITKLVEDCNNSVTESPPSDLSVGAEDSSENRKSSSFYVEI